MTFHWFKNPAKILKFLRSCCQESIIPTACTTRNLDYLVPKVICANVFIEKMFFPLSFLLFAPLVLGNFFFQVISARIPH